MKVNITGSTAQGIFESVKELTSEGALQSGDLLPPVRELAEALGVNRNTVSAAYQRLTQAGITVSEGRRGTKIRQTSAGEQEGTSDTVLIDLADGSPCLEWLPDLNDVAAHTHFSQALYGEATILPGIRDYGLTWFSKDCPADFDITLSNGAIDALERLLSTHLVAGDKVVVEDPCYISAANAIRLAGMNVIGAAVDEFGLRPDALRASLKKGVQAVLITPRAHNPTGASITANRARELQQVLAEFPGVMIMLDDHFALLAQDDYHNVIPDNAQHWAVFRSVSKGLGPDLRMAFVAADKHTVARINMRLAPGMSWVSKVLQSLVLTCLTSEPLRSSLEQAKADCARKRNLICDALSDKSIIPRYTSDGLNIWIEVNGDSQSATLALSKKGWLVRPSQTFNIDQDQQALRVSIKHLDAEAAQQFATDLAQVLSQ